MGNILQSTMIIVPVKWVPQSLNKWFSVHLVGNPKAIGWKIIIQKIDNGKSMSFEESECLKSIFQYSDRPLALAFRVLPGLWLWEMGNGPETFLGILREFTTWMLI